MADQRLEIVLAARDLSGKAFKSVQGHLTRFKNQIFSIKGALAGLASVSGLGYVIKSQLELADSIAKTADKVGISTDALQEYRFAADRAGVSQNALDMGMQRFNRRVAEAAQGQGELKGVLEKYNIQLRDSAGNLRSSEDILNDYANAVKNAESEQEQLRMAFKAFDSEGAALVNMLKQGSGGLDQMRQRARDLGVILDEDLLRKSEKGVEAITDLSSVLRTNFLSVVTELAPDVAKIATGMAEWIAANDDLIRSNAKEYFEGLKDMISGLAEAFKGVSIAAGSFRDDILGFHMVREGDMGFFEWMLKSPDEMKKIVKEYRTWLDSVIEGGTSSTWEEWQATMKQKRYPMPKGPIKIEIGHPGMEEEPFIVPELEHMEWRDMTGWASEYKDVAYDMHRSFADGFFDPMSESFGKLEDLGLSVLDSIKDHIINNFSQSVVDTIFGAAGTKRGDAGSVGWLGMAGSFLASLFHGGGTVGATSPQARAVSPSLFMGAPRLHSGLRADEFPAILQRGETVYPKGAKTMPDIQINVINKGSREMTAEQGPARFDGEKIMLDVVLRGVTSNYGYKQAFKAGLGIG